MERLRFLVVTIAFLSSTVQVEALLQGFKNGQSVVITSVASGKVFSTNTTFTERSTVVVSSWNNELSQKWLALEAPRILRKSPTARDIQPTRYFLVPHRQAWEWATLKQNGTVNVTSTSDLPSQTEVLSIDSVTGNLTTEVLNTTSSSQMWIPEDAREGQILIRNLGNNQCIKNFEYAFQNLYSYFLSVESVPNPLSTFDCNAKDITERWLVEL